MAACRRTAIFEGGPELEWEMDVAWVIRGGADPLAWIEKYKDRITAAHVKDIAPAGENTDEDGWADVGHGTVDWKAIMAALRKHRGQAFRHGTRQPEGSRALCHAVHRFGQSF